MPDQDELLEHVGGFELTVLWREIIGQAPQGQRGSGHLGEGFSRGPKLAGIVLTGGADWWVLRRDGIMEVDAKFMFRTNDGATIQVAYTGVVDFGPDGYERALAGKLAEAPIRSRVAPRLAAADSRYEWVNRSQFVAFGEIDYAAVPTIIRYELYRMI